MSRYVVGDIHGCRAELARLLEHLPLQERDTVVFLGDYIDRGPDSCGVVSDLLALKRQQRCTTVFLKGNHEDMLLSYLGLGGRYGEVFLYNGGRATAVSYGLNSSDARPAELSSAIPADHIAFFKGLQNHCVLDPFLCVHAGINPVKTLELQTEAEILWIRDKFIYSPHRLPYTVLFGHTPSSDVFYDLPYKVGLDTGLVYGNKLTCLELEEKVVYQITRGEKTVNQSSAKARWQNTQSSRRLDLF